MSRFTCLQRGVWTALPFLLLVTAQDVVLDTRVETNGSGLRRIEVRATPQTTDFVRLQRLMATVVPGSRSGRSQQDLNVALWRDDRVANLGRLDGVQVFVQRSLLSPRVRYTFQDTLTIPVEQADAKQTAAAATTALSYRLSLPGTIEQSSVQPAGKVEGSTITWSLKGDQTQQSVTASAMATRYDHVLFTVCVILAAVWLAGRLVLDRLRRAPKRV